MILLSPAAVLKVMLQGKYFIHNGKYVVSSCWSSQHGVVGPYSFVVVTPEALGHYSTCTRFFFAILSDVLDYFTGSVIWTNATI